MKFFGEHLKMPFDSWLYWHFPDVVFHFKNFSSHRISLDSLFFFHSQRWNCILTLSKNTPVWRQRSEKAAMSKFLLFKSFQTITTKYTKLVPFVDVVLWWFILQTQCQGWNWNCKTSNAIVKPRLTHSWVRKRWKQTTVWMCGKRPQQKPNKCLRVTCLLSECHPSTGRMCTLNRSETCFVYILRESRVEWTWETYALHIFRIAKAVASTPSIADPRRATSPSAIVKSLSSHQFE